MSETSSTAEIAEKAIDQTAQFGLAAVDVTANAAHDTINEMNDTVRSGMQRLREAEQHVTKTTAEVGRAASEVAEEAADVSFSRGQKMIASAAEAMDIYRDASERSAERAQALFSSYVTFSRGLHDMRQVWLDMVDQTISRTAHKPRELLRCKTIVELAEMQRDLYLGAVNNAVESTGRLLDIAGRTAQDAVRPLQSNRH
jgi:hypothetical protein